MQIKAVTDLLTRQLDFLKDLKLCSLRRNEKANTVVVQEYSRGPA